MADLKISQLSEVTTSASSDVLPIVSGGTTNKIQLKNLTAIDHTKVTNIGTNTHAQVDTHLGLTATAHGASSNPGAAAAILATNSAGLLTLAALSVSAASVGSDLTARVYNTDNTDGLSRAVLTIQTGGAIGGDPVIQFVSNVSWVMGVDNSDSDKFKWSYQAALGGGDKVTIDSSGNVGIGTTGPDSPLQVNGACHATSFPTTSDKRFKRKVKPIQNAMAGLRRIVGVNFEWNKRINDRLNGYKLNKPYLGFIAQEVEKVFPEVIHTWPLDDEIKDAKGIDFGMMTPILVEAIKELDNRMAKLEVRN